MERYLVALDKWIERLVNAELKRSGKPDSKKERKRIASKLMTRLKKGLNHGRDD